MDWNLFFQGVIAIGTTATAIGVWVAKKQFELDKKSLQANHDWNRREAALRECFKIKEKIGELKSSDFEKYLHYSNRKMDCPYKVEDPHDEMSLHYLFCEFENEDKKILKKIGNDCVIKEERRKLVNEIHEFLNYYEYLATGIIQNILDEEVVKSLNKGNIIKAYFLFENYINHLRKHYNRETIYKNLETIALKWKRENQEEKRKPTA
jgi:hypothetical protein